MMGPALSTSTPTQTTWVWYYLTFSFTSSVSHTTWLDNFFLSSIGLIPKNPGPDELTDLAEIQNIKGLRAIYLNINRLFNKVSRLRQFLYEVRTPTIAAVAETWLEDHHSTDLLKIKGFTLHRFDRGFRHRTKGMACYISNDIEHTKPQCYRELDFTLFHTTVTFQKCKYTIAYVYRPPNNGQLQLARFRTKFIEKMNLIQRTHPVILMGDVNFNLIPHPTPDATRFLNQLEDLGLDQLLTTPTRIKPPSATLVDWLAIDFTTVLSHKYDMINYQPHISDHNCVGVILHQKHQTGTSHKHTYKQATDFTKYDKDDLSVRLRNETWAAVYTANDINSKYTEFEKIVSNHLTATCPTKKVRTCDCPDIELPEKSQPWYSDQLVALRQQMDFMFSQSAAAIGTGRSVEAKEFYDASKKLYMRECYLAKKQYYVRTLQAAKAERNAKKTAKTVKNLSGKSKTSSSIDKIKNADGNIITQPKEIANIIGTYFAEVGLQSSSAADAVLPDNITFPIDPPRMSFVPPGLLATHKKLLDINVSKPAGPGDIPGKFFKEFADQVVFVLEHLFHHCVIRSCIPSAWKQAFVSAIYKNKGEKTDPYNLRPIAITSIISKLFEGLMCDQLVEHLEHNRLLSDTQNGYRKGRSTFHAVTHLTRTVREMCDSRTKKYVGVLFLDLSKAFDCVNHNLLLSMLSRFGLDENSVRLIQSYLSNRMQRVKLSQSVISDIQEIFCGVPQGSILGPILFDIYINGLSKQIDAIVSQYADDTAVIRSSESIQHLVQLLTSDLIKLVAYFKSIGLILNIQKTDYLLFGYNGPGLDHQGDDPRIIIPGSEPIIPSTEAKYLGIIIDSKLNFDAQNKSVLNKLKGAAATIRSIRANITTEVAVQLLHTLFYSRYDYCSLIWHQSNNSYLSKKLETQHRYVLRTVYDTKLNAKPLYDLSNAITLAQRNTLHSAKFTYKFISGIKPENWADFLLRPRLQIGRGAGEGRLRLPPTNRTVEFVTNAVRQKIPTMWNNIPSATRREALQAGTIQTFSQKIMMYLRTKTHVELLH